MSRAATMGMNQAFVAPTLGASRPAPTSVPPLDAQEPMQAAMPSGAAAAAGSSPATLAGLAVLGTSAAAVFLGKGARTSRRTQKQVVSLNAFESELGVQPPVGFWDPLGLSSDGDVAVFKRRRATEIKHGRVSMLATMGYITPELTGKFPGYLSPSMDLKYEDIPNGLAAISKVPGFGWFQIVAYCLYVESTGGFGYNTDQSATEPGDCGWKPPLLATDDPELKKKRLNAELANGRLAMMAIIGMFFQDGLTGSAWGDWANYTDSPLRAFESELGVQAPVGFWDPVGFTSDGDVNAFTRRRESEIKHGRIAMLATMGYITPELTGKFPGYLSPSANLTFEDVPNGLAAISKVPEAGWLQVAAYALFVEAQFAFGGKTKAAPGDFGWKPPLLATSDPTLRTKRLNAELANGRLAMMAIIGMFFQDGLTGSAWGDWANYTDSPLRAFENELGVQAPVGFWDPLGLSSDGDAATFRRRRATEIKHGRISMLATMGYITPELTGKFPGYLSPSEGLTFEDIPNGLAAISKVPGAGWAQIVAYAFFCESSVGFENFQSGDVAPGDCGWKPPLLATDDATLRTKRLNAEIANGRLAMMAIIGMFFQDGLTGSAWGDWSLYTDSPLRAFEAETGVQAPVGFWDPLGLSASGSEFDFKRRREVELKHGRVAMFATMGFITPEYYRFDGFCSPSEGLRFADIPNGLAAISKVPALGWAQIVAFAGWVELFKYDEQVNGEPGNYGAGSLALKSVGIVPGPFKDPEERKRQLNKELANGRLAMMAIIGMFFQDGLTGSAWGDWALYTDSPLR
eukprot:CAMPEP_0204580066 /NCGR_PEP_ID=MMETSP0661-20131031/43846_1 /ASSEMBLY_ACC=CAM_ASM_000606 /TAXON_ID=109239 /ORGANISM="Alexandrium margalefi, Strain AMGDE01CS-322" /LENGTH=800 /DNA_ID=CAMNT_0051589131 /DNA_START=52 /DNA_END=2454 /DNA_ORIENTATION=+